MSNVQFVPSLSHQHPDSTRQGNQSEDWEESQQADTSGGDQRAGSDTHGKRSIHGPHRTGSEPDGQQDSYDDCDARRILDP